MTKTGAMAVITGLFFAGVLPAKAQQQTSSDSLSFSGDFRLRYEGIDEEGEVDRNRMRFRARLGLTADVYDDVKIILQLATGGDNPVSTNQSFDDGFSTKDMGVDLAYVEWVANDEITLFAGKMKNPLFRAGGAPLVWDGDLNPEGVAGKFERGAFFGNAGFFWAEERSSADDSLLYAVQAGMSFDVRGEGELIAGVGYFGYTDTAGKSPAPRLSML